MIFSYWIFVWYLLYIYKFTNYNPKFVLILGLIENFIMLVLMIYFNSKFVAILSFIIINTLLKVYPLYTLWNDKIKNQDIFASFILLICYVFYLYLHKESITSYQMKIFKSLINNKNETPFLQLITSVRKYFVNIQIL